MSAQITNGRWTRNVTWERDGVWRTDIFKSTLADPRLQEAQFILRGGPTVIIPATELRRVLVGGTEHYDGLIWGPFNIDPSHRTVEGQLVEMEVIAEPDGGVL
jgi:hypothetical protein